MMFTPSKLFKSVASKVCRFWNDSQDFDFADTSGQIMQALTSFFWMTVLLLVFR